MKILFYQWNAYNLADIKMTFEALGHDITMLTEPIENPEVDSDYTDRLCAILKNKQYDFVFSVNFFPVIAKSCYDTDTLYVSWNCDSPLLAMYHESIFYSTNVVFTFDYSNYQEFKALGVTYIYHLPLAVNSKRLQSQIHYEAPATYPVSFVGRLYEKNSYDAIAPSLPDYLCGYLEGAMKAQIAVSGGNLLEPLLTDEICMKLEEITDYHQSEQSFASIRMLFATTVLGFKTASMERIRNLNALSLQTRDIHIFTDSPTDDLSLVQTHNPIDYWTEMPQIFYESKINLNMTIPNIKTGIPLRIWDILGSTGFVLSNYQLEFNGLFTAGQTLDVFEDIDELKDKTAFYLAHDTLRCKIAKAGFELVHQEHTYVHRIQTILDIINTL